MQITLTNISVNTVADRERCDHSKNKNVRFQSITRATSASCATASALRVEALELPRVPRLPHTHRGIYLFVLK